MICPCPERFRPPECLGAASSSARHRRFSCGTNPLLAQHCCDRAYPASLSCHLWKYFPRATCGGGPDRENCPRFSCRPALLWALVPVAPAGSCHRSGTVPGASGGSLWDFCSGFFLRFPNCPPSFACCSERQKDFWAALRLHISFPLEF